MITVATREALGQLFDCVARFAQVFDFALAEELMDGHVDILRASTRMVAATISGRVHLVKNGFSSHR